MAWKNFDGPDDAELDRLCDLYLRSNRALVKVRQAHLSALGDGVDCATSAEAETAEAGFDLTQIEALGAAEAMANDVHTRCSLAVAAALVARVQTAIRK